MFMSGIPLPTIRIGTNQTATYIQGVINGNGSGLTGLVPGAGSPYYIQNRTTRQTSANFNIDGNGSANSFNSASTYQIGGGSLLSMGSPADGNVFGRGSRRQQHIRAGSVQFLHRLPGWLQQHQRLPEHLRRRASWLQQHHWGRLCLMFRFGGVSAMFPIRPHRTG